MQVESRQHVLSLEHCTVEPEDAGNIKDYFAKITGTVFGNQEESKFVMYNGEGKPSVCIEPPFLYLSFLLFSPLGSFLSFNLIFIVSGRVASTKRVLFISLTLNRGVVFFAAAAVLLIKLSSAIRVSLNVMPCRNKYYIRNRINYHKSFNISNVNNFSSLAVAPARRTVFSTFYFDISVPRVRMIHLIALKFFWCHNGSFLTFP